MEFIGLQIAGFIVWGLFWFGVGRKWETLNSPEDIVAAYGKAKAKLDDVKAKAEAVIKDAEDKIAKAKSVL